MSVQNENCSGSCCNENTNHQQDANTTDAIFNLIMVCQLIPSMKEHRSLTSLHKCLDTIESLKTLSVLDELMKRIENITYDILTEYLSSSLQDPGVCKYSKTLSTRSDESTIDTSWENTFANKFRVNVEGYCLLFFAFLGVIGNVSGIFYILKKKRRSQFFNMMLLPLLVFDALYTATEFVMSFEEHILPFPLNFMWIYRYLLYPLRRVSLGASIFMTIALAHERLCSVNRPILQRNSFLSSKRRQHRRLAYVIPVVTASLFANIFAFWEVEIVEIECNRKRVLGNASGCFTPSSLRTNDYFSWYYVGLLRLLVFGIYPFTSLFYFNYKISRSIKINSFRGTGGNINQKEILRRRTIVEKRTTKVLVAIIISFLVSHLPRVILNAMDFYIIKQIVSGDTPSEDPLPVYVIVMIVMSSITRLLLVLNMSLNVGYYLYFTLFNKLWSKGYHRGSKSSVMLFERWYIVFTNTLSFFIKNII